MFSHAPTGSGNVVPTLLFQRNTNVSFGMSLTVYLRVRFGFVAGAEQARAGS
jgi:hypothetical protein